MKTASKAISILFHPLLFTTYLVVILSWWMPHFLLIPASALWKFTGFVLIITFVFPVINLFMLRSFGSIASVEMPERRERILPFVLITVFYAILSALFFYKVSMNVNFNKMMLIVVCLTAVATVITFFFKISVHSLAMGGAVGILLPLNNVAGGNLLWPVAGLILLTGLVMSARLYLQAHTLRETLYGTGVGFVTGLTGMTVLF
ncbi:MAG: hypothetical protein SH819_13110 [Cytophagales bacterium]|nr:hypothetical protein [Cytophagales bacterium]